MKEFLLGRTGLVTTSPLQKPLKSEIDRLVRLVQQVLKGGLAEQFAQAIQALADHGDELSSAVVVWIEVIQRLVQAAEQRYPHKHGTLKKSIVKSAARYLIDHDRFDVPSVPEYLQPFLLDVLVDWSIDVIVEMSNDHGLWDTGKATESYLRDPLMRFLHWIDAIGEKIWPLLVAVPLGIWRLLHQELDLTPELKAALDEVVKRRLLSRKVDLLGKAPEAIVWVGDHGPELKALVQLVTEGVQLAEGFLDKTGPEKKEYVRALVMATLQELGISFGIGLIAILANTFLDTAIDSAVNEFNTFPQHSPAFKHRKPPASAPMPSQVIANSNSTMGQSGLLGLKLRKFPK